MGVFRAPDGKISATRVVFVIWALASLAIWAIVSISEFEVQDFPDSIATLIAALAVGRAGQSFAEVWAKKG